MVGLGYQASRQGLMWYFIYIYIFLVSAAIGLVMTKAMIRMSHKMGVYDVPAGRKDHGEPVPYLGGAAIYLSFMIVIGSYTLELVTLHGPTGYAPENEKL